MILRGRIIWVDLVVFIFGHAVGLELESTFRPMSRRRVPEGRLKEGMSPYVMQLSHHELITMGSRQGLEVVDRGILLVLGTAIAPFAPVTGRVTGLCQDVPHGQVFGPHGLLCIVRIVAISKGVALMKTSLLGRAGGRTDRATVSPPKIHPDVRQAVQVRGQHVGLALGLAVGLAVGANRSPTHVVDVEVEDVGTLRSERGFNGEKENSQQTDQDGFCLFHGNCVWVELSMETNRLSFNR